MISRSSFKGQYVDIFRKTVFPAEVQVENGKIKKVMPLEEAPDVFILPGFIDAHIHIESAMLVPSEFSRIVVRHGTVATVSDPHEIANLCGLDGIAFMMDNAGHSPLKVYFGAPSCVPATGFETAGAVIGPDAIRRLLQRPGIKYLSEMMNFPGVLQGDEDVLAKIDAAKQAGKPVDGHAPGLRGADARKYAAAGITTDHECVCMEEALDKIHAGMYIIIREGSAAKNFDALIGLLKTHPGKIMFCSDDKHPDELVKGHINQLVARALQQGCDLFDVLYAACVLPVQHYKLDVGLLREGDPADFIVVGNLRDFPLQLTCINGNVVAENGDSLIAPVPVAAINRFSCTAKRPVDFRLPAPAGVQEISVRIIDALDGQLVTGASDAVLQVGAHGEILPDTKRDLIKIGVVNRYADTPPSLAFVRNFGLQKGAIASSVAHDSHNIVFAGVDDDSICAAVNAIIRHRGGISAYDGARTHIMPLPVAGLMTDKDAAAAAAQYEAMNAAAKALGSGLSAPFMTLSFMALPVIPDLKITDKGLFDVRRFRFTPIPGSRT